MEITIRHSEPSDAEAVHRLFTGERAFAGTLQLPYQSVESWRTRLASQADGAYNLLACIGPEVVGSAGLHTIMRPRRRHAADIGIVVRDDMQGRGVGKALMTALMDLADNWLNLQRIELTVFADNQAAIALYTRFGFEIEGTFRRYAFRDGAYVDAHAMARLRA